MVKEHFAWGTEIGNLLEREIRVAQFSKDATNSGNIKFRSHNHRTSPAVGFKYLVNRKHRLVSPGRLPLDDDGLRWHARQHQPFGLQRGLVKAGVTTSGADNDRS